MDNNREDIPSKIEVDSGQYFLEARNWYYDKYISIFTSRTKVLLLMIVSSLAVILVISNIVNIFPLVTFYPVHISHRVTDGSVIPRLYIADSHKNPDVAVLNVLVAQYVRSREIFDSIGSIDNNIKIISNISSPEVKREYEDFLYKSKESPLFALRQNDKRESEIISIDFINDNNLGQMDNYNKLEKKPSSSLGIDLIPNRAKILFKTYIINQGTNNIREETLWLADMEFTFFGIQKVEGNKDNMESEFQLENFAVTKYNLTKQ